MTPSRLVLDWAGEQVAYARKLVTAAGQAFEVIDLPEMAHAMRAHDPQQLVDARRVDFEPEFDRLSRRVAVPALRVPTGSLRLWPLLRHRNDC
jgi:hypothetical protein